MNFLFLLISYISCSGNFMINELRNFIVSECEEYKITIDNDKYAFVMCNINIDAKIKVVYKKTIKENIEIEYKGDKTAFLNEIDGRIELLKKAYPIRTVFIDANVRINKIRFSEIKDLLCLKKIRAYFGYLCFYSDDLFSEHGKVDLIICHDRIKYQASKYTNNTLNVYRMEFHPDNLLYQSAAEYISNDSNTRIKDIKLVKILINDMSLLRYVAQDRHIFPKNGLVEFFGRIGNDEFLETNDCIRYEKTRENLVLYKSGYKPVEIPEFEEIQWRFDDRSIKYYATKYSEMINYLFYLIFWKKSIYKKYIRLLFERKNDEIIYHLLGIGYSIHLFDAATIEKYIEEREQNKRDLEGKFIEKFVWYNPFNSKYINQVYKTILVLPIFEMIETGNDCIYRDMNQIHTFKTILLPELEKYKLNAGEAERDRVFCTFDLFFENASVLENIKYGFLRKIMQIINTDVLGNKNDEVYKQDTKN